MEVRRMSHLPELARDAVVAHVHSHGQTGVESGGFLVNDDTGRVVVVACAGTTGISRSWGLFRISGAALDRLFTWCEDRDQTIGAMFHSHEHMAFLSMTDREHGLNVRGMTSVVLPSFAKPPSDPAAWAWFVYDGSDWVPLDPWPLSSTGVSVVTFDEDGVHE
ncbi:MAG: hypothetical protein AB7H92_15820 [Microbacteriaceae bacterium]